MILARRSHSVLPGFGVALGCTLLYLGIVVLLPLSAAFFKTFTLSWDAFVAAVANPRVVASLKLSFGAALAAAAINAIFGLLVAWVLVRYRFLGRRLLAPPPQLHVPAFADRRASRPIVEGCRGRDDAQRDQGSGSEGEAAYEHAAELHARSPTETDQRRAAGMTRVS